MITLRLGVQLTRGELDQLALSMMMEDWRNPPLSDRERRKLARRRLEQIIQQHLKEGKL